MAMAKWCMQTGYGPDAYRSLTAVEREVFWQLARDEFEEEGI